MYRICVAISSMKPNLNNVILDSQTYLMYLFENKHIKHTDYDKFLGSFDPCPSCAEFIQFCETLSVDIYPYLYTLSCITSKELDAFVKFLSSYMIKTGFLSDCKDLQEGSLYDIVQISAEHVYIFIVSMQYYFL